MVSMDANQSAYLILSSKIKKDSCLRGIAHENVLNSPSKTNTYDIIVKVKDLNEMSSEFPLCIEVNPLGSKRKTSYDLMLQEIFICDGFLYLFVDPYTSDRGAIRYNKYLKVDLFPIEQSITDSDRTSNYASDEIRKLTFKKIKDNLKLNDSFAGISMRLLSQDQASFFEYVNTITVTAIKDDCIDIDIFIPSKGRKTKGTITYKNVLELGKTIYVSEVLTPDHENYCYHFRIQI